MGFLSISNRVCVALSRAKWGFFVIGNFQFLQKASEKKKTVWSDIVKHMVEAKAIENGLPVGCGKHPDNDELIRTPKDFDKRPEGGCMISCDYRLKCGHTCPRLCHMYDAEHLEIKCTTKCNKKISCGHVCKEYECYHKIGRCNPLVCFERVKKVLPCGHSGLVKCNEMATQGHCSSICDRMLPCHHKCLRPCKETPCGSCQTQVQVKTLCDHNETVRVICRIDLWELQEKCAKPCAVELECGHLCSANCGDCFGGRVHRACTEKCTRSLICGHACSAPCGKQCPPCQKNCHNRCVHSRCPKTCSEACAPCKESCAWKCEHKKCTRKCHEVCDRAACNEPCKKKLKCGHDCIGFCGEPCPPYCRRCDRKVVTEILFGSEDEPNARFVFLEDCRHIIEAEAMDHWMRTQYGDDSNNNDGGKSEIGLPVCPKCKTQIRLNLRYSNVVKKQLAQIEVIKKRYRGSEAKIMLEYKEVIGEIAQLGDGLRETLFADVEMDERKMKYSQSDIILLQNKLTLHKSLKDMETKLDKIREGKHWNCMVYEFKKLERCLVKAKCFSNKKEDFPFKLTQQRVRELSDEIKRFSKVFDYFKCKEGLIAEHRPKAVAYFEYLEETLIKSTLPYSHIEKTVNKCFEKLRPLFSGLQITNDEKVMILKAMQLEQGHWYKCKNGHVYCITECGGAMEESKCPECGARIGGANHALLGDNAVATEMDGARHAAWSEQNNLANFNLNNLI